MTVALPLRGQDLRKVSGQRRSYRNTQTVGDPITPLIASCHRRTMIAPMVPKDLKGLFRQVEYLINPLPWNNRLTLFLCGPTRTAIARVHPTSIICLPPEHWQLPSFPKSCATKKFKVNQYWLSYTVVVMGWLWKSRPGAVNPWLWLQSMRNESSLSMYIWGAKEIMCTLMLRSFMLRTLINILFWVVHWSLVICGPPSVQTGSNSF